MRMKKILVALLILVMIVSGTTSTKFHVQAAEGDIVKIVDQPEFIVKPGDTSQIKLSVQASKYIHSPIMEVSSVDANAPFIFGKASLTMNGSATEYITSNAPSDLGFDVKVKDTAKIGNYKVNITFTYDDVMSDTEMTSTITTTIKVQEEKNPAQITVGDISLGDSNLGSKTNLSFVVKNEGELAAKSVFVTMNFFDAIEGRYTAKDIKVGDLNAGDSQLMKLPISILPTASVGRVTITANFTYKTIDGDKLSSSYNLYLNLTSVTSVTQLPKLSIDNIDYTQGLKPGDKFELKVNLDNIGGSAAENIKVTMDDASVDTTGIIKNYFTDGITADDLKANYDATIKVPLKVSKYATNGLKSVKIVVTYTNAAGNSYTTNEMVYVDVTASAVTPTPALGGPNIIISNVDQSPTEPIAGDKVEISFDVENKSKVDASEVKISTEGLTSSTFIPIKSEPYLYYETLKAGEKIHVTIPFIVSKSIVEGLNNITIKCSYAGGGEGSTAIIPIRNVKNAGGISKPKLIISKYLTDVEDLRAGTTFNFTFDVYNTNSSVAAKNITVTVSQADNIFTVTQGSNSFFINNIAPGESVTEKLEMKVKSDATTKAYPLEILIEYEYDGAEPNPTTGEIGEKRTEKLSLQAVENSRPVVDNVNVYSYDGAVMAGTPATLSFEFYNMGRSPLNNVIVRLEGDGFTKTDGDMYFIGNAAEGSSTYAEFPVMPNSEGSVSGVLKVSFEDSNGDTVEVSKDFTSDVMPAAVIDPGSNDPGAGEVFNPGPIAKKAIIPIWAFFLMEGAIFILFIPITRKIIISAYKNKLRNKEQDQY